MNHAQFEERLAIYRDLQGAERARVDEHLRGCAHCAARLQSYQAMDRELANLSPLQPDRRLGERFYTAIEDNMQGKRQTGASSGKSPSLGPAPRLRLRLHEPAEPRRRVPGLAVLGCKRSRLRLRECKRAASFAVGSEGKGIFRLFGAMSQVAGAVAIIVVIVALWAVFQAMNNSGLNSAGRTTPFSPLTSTSTTEEVRGRLTASSGQAFEYTLSMPANWTGKYGIEQYADRVTINYFPPTGVIAPTIGPVLFGISALTQAEWEAEQKGPHGNELLTRDGVVFVENIGLDNPLSGSEAEEFQQMAGQVNDIVRTFTVAPAPPGPPTLPPNAATLAPTRTPAPNAKSPDDVISLAWSPSSKIMAAATKRGIVFYDRDTVAAIRTLDEGEYTESITFSTDGARLACTCGEGVIKLWDVDSGQLLKTLMPSNEDKYFTSVAFSPNGQYLAGGTFNGAVKVWDARGEKLLQTINGPNASIFRLLFSSDSQRILAGALDGSVKVWNAESGQLLRTVVDHEAQDVEFSPDGTRVAVTNQSDDAIHILDINSGGLLAARDGLQVMGFAFTADGNVLACICKAKSGIPLWDASSGKAIGTIAINDPNLTRLIAFSPGGKHVATSMRDGKVLIIPTPSAQGTATAPSVPTASGTPLTPVSPTLSPNAIVGGRLAYVIQTPPAKARVDVLDLAGKGSWSFGNPPLTPLGWSPSGQYLLVLESDNQYAVYRYDGTLSGRYSALAQPFWAPLDALPGARDWLALQDSNGNLQAIQFPGGQTREVLTKNLGKQLPDRVIWSRDGWLAWTPNMDGIAQQVSKAQPLYIRRVDDANSAQSWKISGDATQAYYYPIDWVPGTRYILAAKGALCNSCWSWGLPLVRIDADTGEIRDLGAAMLLTREAYDWNPTQPGLLALAVGGSRYLFDEHRLAILDVKNAALQYLTDPGTSAFEPAWFPDGKFLAYARMPASPNASGDGQTLERTLEGRIIITVDPAKRIFAPLTRPGQAIDGWPHWSADGKYLLYARKHDGVTDVHLVNWDDAQDQILVSGLAAPVCNYGGCGWSSMLEYSALPK